jgi:hypothetical protein
MVEHDEVRGEEKPGEQVRVTFTLPVYVQGTGNHGGPFGYLTTVENISRRGAFLRLDELAEPGQVVTLASAQEPSRRLCEMEVVWSRDSVRGPAGAGVKLVGDNEDWMAYLIEHSVKAAEGESPDEF